MKKSESKDYIEDLNKWQENMYQPGAYLGADVPPHIKYGGKKMRYLLLFTVIIVILSFIIVVLF